MSSFETQLWAAYKRLKESDKQLIAAQLEYEAAHKEFLRASKILAEYIERTTTPEELREAA